MIIGLYNCNDSHVKGANRLLIFQIMHNGIMAEYVMFCFYISVTDHKNDQDTKYIYIKKYIIKKTIRKSINQSTN